MSLNHLSGRLELLDKGPAGPFYPDPGPIQSAFAIALHMQQPLIPAGGDDLKTAALISNLQYMLEHPGLGDNHNAVVFRECYRRMADFIPQLVAEGKNPRVMVEYTGVLLEGLERMGAQDVLEALARLAHDPHVEWLGCPWGHAVAPSTPVQDYRLHVQAWRHHFASLFGREAVARVRGFSPSEMALPNHPDVAYEFVRTLAECGYGWVLVQEHTVEGVTDPHLPHRLVCRSSRGEQAEIVALIKTGGSDTKLVGQMQPYYEARELGPVELGGVKVPPLVTQIADGENGGVMMNEFSPKFLEVMRECSGSPTPAVTGTQYLEHLERLGVNERSFPEVQPLFHSRIWSRMEPGDGPQRLAEVVAELRHEDDRFHLEGGSWTSDISWVRGYDEVLGPMERVSSLFYEKVLKPGCSPAEARYQNALLHLLTSQTSCFRYWGSGTWTDYGREICRRAHDILVYDF